MGVPEELKNGGLRARRGESGRVNGERVMKDNGRGEGQKEGKKEV